MREPKVQRLEYEIVSGKDVTYDNPAELDFTNALGAFTTSNGILVVEPAEHFVRESEARSAIEPFLRSWKISAELSNQSIGGIDFRFLNSEIIPGEDHTIYPELGGFVFASGEVSFHITRKAYPQPLATFQLSNDAESAYLRWLGYKEGREPLQSMAYFILTMLERIAGGRNAAAGLFQIDEAVLRKIGELTSTKGSALTARKARPSGELEGSDQAWLEKVVPILILRIGDQAGNAALTQITMSDI